PTSHWKAYSLNCQKLSNAPLHNSFNQFVEINIINKLSDMLSMSNWYKFIWQLCKKTKGLLWPL
ncbi:MAG: hypothetical protein SFU87_11830, partial [Chitinophagaceae bacterium]|nr:hypothetical protein [Chitinophagaceae bacterium]